MTGPRIIDGSDSGWDIAFWFAVLSPIIGVLRGFFVPLLIYH
ncbi:MAG TPA: hypothetical protein VLK27_06550 [Chthoniobacterales bacterium]|nr:hypothetical protein [Chthoniobacterales bacterium]